MKLKLRWFLRRLVANLELKLSNRLHAELMLKISLGKLEHQCLIKLMGQALFKGKNNLQQIRIIVVPQKKRFLLDIKKCKKRKMKAREKREKARPKEIMRAIKKKLREMLMET